MIRPATLITLLFLFSAVVNAGAWESSGSPYPTQQSPAEVEKRVSQLLSALTLDEKIGLLAGDGQDGMSTKAIPRLGIPKLVMADGPQGVRAHGPACSFPSGIALAATWDPTLAFRYGEALGREARARGIHLQLGPGVNIARTPLNGRNFEYFGEDPCLTGKMAAAWVRGLQSQGVTATVKHFVGNDAEWRRMEIDTLMDEQTLREIYLQPFYKTLMEGGAWSVMSAYNKLNGEQCTANTHLQQEVLKREWGFPGVVMSDWWATQSVEALANGLDLEMPMEYRLTPENIYRALVERKLSQEQIDEAVRRQLRMGISMGFFDRPQQRADLPLDSATNAAVALETATKSIVLLKNSPSLLPLDRTRLQKVVVYGPNAQDTPTVGGGSGGVTPFRKVSFIQGIRRALPPQTQVLYAPMPLYETVSPSRFLDFPQSSTVLPVRILNIRKMVGVPEDHLMKVTPSRESRIEVSWDSKHPPKGVEKGKEASIIWDAEIVAPATGNYEIETEGHPEIRLGEKELGNPRSYVTPLLKGVPVPLRVTAHEVGRGEGKVSLRVAPVLEESTGVIPAKGADVAIVCVGLNPDAEGEGYDRGFSLPVSQQRLIREVAEANPNTVVVLSGGAAVDMRPWIGKVPAVLQTWYLGQEAGTALASLLFGDENPSGHLPCTFDRDIDENPAFRHYPGDFPEGKAWPVVNYHEGIFYGYRGYDRSGREPLFPFGHGLSYTSFEMSDLKLSRKPGGCQAAVSVTNTGNRPGATVLQLYVGLSGEPTARPLRELKAFQRVELKPGETHRVTLEVPDDALAYWDPGAGRWTLPVGTVSIQVGFSERDIRLKNTLP